MATKKKTRPACEFDGCDRPQSSKGYCSTHYAQQHRGDEMTPIHTRGNVQRCKGPGCDRRARAKGLCSTHYAQRLHGKQLTRIKPRESTKPGPHTGRLPLVERIDASTKRDKSTGCLKWTRAKNLSGSGVLNIDGRTTVVNGVAYDLWFGTDIGSAHVRKACGEPSCIEPAHLYVKGVTRDWEALDDPQYTAHEMKVPDGWGWMLVKSINDLDVSRSEAMSRPDVQAAHRVFVGGADKAKPTANEIRTWLKYLTFMRQGHDSRVVVQPLR